MKTLWGALMVDGRGKLGGHVAQRGTYGSILRTKVTPVNRQSSPQQLRKSLVSSLTKDWKHLTESQRILWNNFAVQNPKTDVFGSIITISGFNMYLQVNLNLINMNKDGVFEPGTSEVVERIFYDFGVEEPDDAGLIVIITFKPDIPATLGAVVYATSFGSAGISSGGTRYKQIAVLDDTATSPYDITAEYTAVFGDIANFNTKFFIKAVQISYETGLAYPPLIASAIVTKPPPP